MIRRKARQAALGEPRRDAATTATLLKDPAMMTITTPEAPLPQTFVEPPHVARVGVKDVGHNVTTMCGEPVDGRIADLADGDA